MLGSLEGYIKRRSKTHHTAMRVFFSDSPHPQEEYLDSLWQQIKRLRSEMWIEKHIIRPYLAFDSVLCEALQHNLPPMVSLRAVIYFQKGHVISRFIMIVSCRPGFLFKAKG